jgi:hypothetical protein
MRKFIVFYLEILKIRSCFVYEVVDPIFQQQPHKKFWMNFDHVYVHLIQSAEMLWVIGIYFCLFIYHRSYIIKDLSKMSWVRSFFVTV